MRNGIREASNVKETVDHNNLGVERICFWGPREGISGDEYILWFLRTRFLQLEVKLLT